MMTLDELLRLQSTIDTLKDQLAQAQAHRSKLERRLAALLSAWNTAAAQRDEAAQAVSDCEAAAQRLPAERQAVKDLEAVLGPRSRQLEALQAALELITRFTQAWQKADRLKQRQLAQRLVADLERLYPNLPPQAQQDVDWLKAAIQAGQAIDLFEVKKRLDQWQVLLNELRKQVTVTQRQLAAARSRLEADEQRAAQLPQAKAALATAQAEVDVQERPIQALRANLAALERELGRLQGKLTPALAEFNRTLYGAMGQLKPGVPLVLLPVRLETRYVDTTSGDKALLIRIYPDDIAQDSLQPALSSEEQERGKRFWGDVAQASTEAERQMLWGLLVRRYSAGRAAWIIANTNPQMQPGEQVAPRPPMHVYARGLPERFVAVGYVHGAGGRLMRAFTQWGRVIRQPLLSTLLTSVKNEERWLDGIDEGARWMVNFAAAEQAGMGLRVPLPAGAPQAFDQVLVFGVRCTLGPEESSVALEQLLEAHHYTWGLRFLAQGTATNNTEVVASGMRRDDPGGLRSYRDELEGYVIPGRNGSAEAFYLTAPDGAHVGDALGLSTEAIGRLHGLIGPGTNNPPLNRLSSYTALSHIGRSGAFEQQSAADMNRVLWPATGGYFLHHVMAGQYDAHHDLRFPECIDERAWRNYFIQHVRGRGPLPAMQVGRQPYGLLPVTSLDFWRPWGSAAGARGQDLVVLTSAPPPSPNDPCWTLRILRGVREGRPPTTWLKTDMLPGTQADGRITGMALADVCHFGRRDLVCLRLPPVTSTRAELLVGRNLRPSGACEQWSAPIAHEHPSAGQYVGGGLAAADINQDGDVELIVVRFEQPRLRGNVVASYYVCSGLDGAGSVTFVSKPFSFPSAPSTTILASCVTVADVNQDGRPELVICYASQGSAGIEIYLQILVMNEDGSLAQSSAPVRQKDLESLLGVLPTTRFHGAGLTADTLAPTGRSDLLLVIGMEDAPAQPGARFARAVGVDAGGNVREWQHLGTTWLERQGVGQVEQVCGLVAGQVGRAPEHTDLRTEEGVVNTLSRLRDRFWHAALEAGSVPRVNVEPAALNRHVLRLLAQTGIPAAFKLERLLSAQALAELWAERHPGDARAQVSTYSAAAQQRLRQFLLEIGQPGWDPALFHWLYLEQRGLDPYPVTPVAATVSETEGIAQDSALWDFMTSASEWSPDRIHTVCEALGRYPKEPLLLRLLLVSTLWAYIEAFRQVMNDYLIEPHRVPDENTVTPWHYLNTPHYALNGRTPGEVLFRRKGVPGVALDLQPAYAYLDAFFASLKRLSELPSAELERLLLETLDLFGSRLDAYITSAATQRLRGLRALTPSGVYVGSYGWVENITPRSPATLPSGGFIHAPSTTHAAAAAVLRSGYLAHDSTGKDKALAVNLSSRRVRRALELVEGLRQGLSLGQMLGYRLERACRGTLGRYILPLRRKFPLAANKLNRTDEPLEAIAANNVVDGLKLLRVYQDDYHQETKTLIAALGQEPELGLPTAQPDDLVNLKQVLDDQLDTLDALNDLGLAEAVFQAVQGNYNRSSASVEALGSAEVPLPDFDVVRTPRTGQSAAHRLVVLFNEAPRQGPGEFARKGWAETPRAQAEPALNELAARLLGDPRRVVCSVTYIHPTTQQALAGLPEPLITLGDLEVCPLDVLSAWQVDSEAGQSDLEQRLAYTALVTRRPAALPAHEVVGVCLSFQRKEGWPPDVISFAELMEVAHVAREVITSGRALIAADLLPPQADAGGIVITEEAADEMARRAKGAAEGLAQAIYTLEGLLAQPWADQSKPDLSAMERRQALGDALLRLSCFGLAVSIPPQVASPTKGDWSLSLQQCTSALTLAAERHNSLPLPPEPAATAAERYAQSVAILQAVFGEGFKVMPVFSLLTADAGTNWLEHLQQAADQSEAQGATAPTIYRWFQKIARVRRGAAKLQEAILYQETLNSAAARQAGFQIFQLPITDGNDQWVGIAPHGGRTSIAAWTPLPLNVSGEPFLAGLLLDNWVEVTPSRSETTGVSFHYDAPGATAPQAVLLAVSPDPSVSWDLATLEATLIETLDLAKLRAVRLYDVPGIGHYLPALFVAQNTAHDTISFRD